MERGYAGARRDQAARAEGLEAAFAGFLREDDDAETVSQFFGDQGVDGWMDGTRILVVCFAHISCMI